MITFQAGDRVKYTGNDSPGLVGMVATVTEQTTHYSAHVKWDDGQRSRVYPGNLTLLERADEALPPVPESPMYFGLGVAPNRMDVYSFPQISELCVQVMDTQGRLLAVYFDPEDAIQLAYDIKRMARKLIKERDSNG